MNAGKKIVCLGGGAFYFKDVIKYFPLAETLRDSEIVLYDINEERARRIAALGQRLEEVVSFHRRAVRLYRRE